MSDDRSDVHLDARTEALQTWAAATDRESRAELLQRLYQLRREQRRPRLTQAEVAARMGISQATVSAFESRKAIPRLATLQRYARAIGVRLVVTLEYVSPEEEFTDRLAELDTAAPTDDREADLTAHAIGPGGRRATPDTSSVDPATRHLGEPAPSGGPLNPRFSAAS